MPGVRCLQRTNSLKAHSFATFAKTLEKNINPIHVHVEATSLKANTMIMIPFLGAEAATFLKLYLEQRRKVTTKNSTENLTDESPLIRDETIHKPKPIGSKQIRKIVHQLYKEAGLIKQPNGRMYDLRVHSMRKYFKTQLLALGVQPTTSTT